MYELVFWLTLLIVGSPIWFVLALLTIFALAYANIGWTLVKQNHIKVVMAGESFVRFIVNVRGYHRNTDNEGNLVPVDPAIRGSDGKSWLNRLGIDWVGWPPIYKILRYPFAWNKLVQNRETATPQITPREELVDSIIFNYAYGVQLKDVEIGGNLRVNIDLLVTIWVLNPFKLLFRTLPPGNWLQQVVGSITEVVTLYAANKSVNELRELSTGGKVGETSKPKPAAVEFSKMIKSINKRRASKNDGVEELFGAHIEVVNFLGLEVVGTEEEQKAARAQEIARLKALAAIEEANGLKAARIIAAEGEVQYETQVGGARNTVLIARKKELGEAAFVADRRYEGIKDFKGSTLVEGGGVAGVMVGVGQQTPAQPPATPSPPPTNPTNP